MLKQTALYWGTPAGDGRGGFTFDAPVEVDCYWATRQELFVSAAGRQELSRAVIYLASAVEVEGWLYLGELDDLASSVNGPHDLVNAYKVRATAEIPSVSGLQTLYKAWL